MLEDPRFKATVFAPNNDAWERLPQQLGLPDEAALMGDPRLGSVLLYHILPFKAKVGSPLRTETETGQRETAQQVMCH